MRTNRVGTGGSQEDGLFAGQFGGPDGDCLMFVLRSRSMLEWTVFC